MNRSWRIPPIAIAALALGFGAAFLIQANSAIKVDANRDAMIGTWTDENGEPGNSIRFYFVKDQDIPGEPLVTAWYGHATMNGLLDMKEATATWGYGGWDPLVLNLTIGKKAWFVVIRKLGDEHLLMRFATDAEEIYRPGAIEHPDTRKFKRIGREPGF